MRKVTHERDLADEALSLARINAWRGLADFNGESLLSTRLHRIAYNAAVSVVRSDSTVLRRNSVPYVEPEAGMVGAVDDDYDIIDVRQTLMKVFELLETLPEAERDIFERCRIDKVPQIEVARELGVNRSTVAKVLTKVESFLRESLGRTDIGTSRFKKTA